MNTLCVASQLNPHVISFVLLLAFARLGVIREQTSAAREHSPYRQRGTGPRLAAAGWVCR